MALYSWFTKNNNKPSKKSVRAKNNLLKASESAKYIENYTMWPTAKIKQSIEVTLPDDEDVVDVENKLAKEPSNPKSILEDKSISPEVVLVINK